MKMPGPRVVDRQRRLFPRDITSQGMARCMSGSFYEKLTASVSGAIRLKTDSQCWICPDLKFDDSTYFETKGSGNSGAVIFYEARLKKDQKFLEETGYKLVYWIWCHKYPVLDAETDEQLFSGLLKSTHTLILVHPDLLFYLAFSRETRVVNSGSQNYAGWTLKTSEIKDRCFQKKPLVIDGHRINVFSSHPELSLYLDGKRMLL